MEPTARLPGDELIEPGLRDLAAGVRSEEALLVLATAPRLRRAGLAVPGGGDELGAYHALYESLSERLGERAHSRHHAMMRRASSYAVAYARARDR